MKRSVRPLLLGFCLLTLLAALPALSAPLPSKTATNQSIDSLQTDLGKVKNIDAAEQEGLAGSGEMAIDSELSLPAKEERSSLVENLNYVQPAGRARSRWMEVAIGVLVVFLILEKTKW